MPLDTHRARLERLIVAAEEAAARGEPLDMHDCAKCLASLVVRDPELRAAYTTDRGLTMLTISGYGYNAAVAWLFGPGAGSLGPEPEVTDLPPGRLICIGWRHDRLATTSRHGWAPNIENLRSYVAGLPA